MKIQTSVLDKINSCHTLISLIEQEEKTLRAELAKRKNTYKGRYTNLVGYKKFFEEHELQKQSSNLDFDLEICEKALGKKLIKAI